MKIIQIPFCFYPDPVGGTEVYVEALSKNLQEQGCDIVVASPGRENSAYFHNNLKVRRFSVLDRLELAQLYGEGDPSALKEFVRILEDEKPEIVHLHAFTSANSLKLVMAARQRGVRVFFTYHTPMVSCQRGTLMHRGKTVCNGKLNLHKCASCRLQSLGMSRLGADILGSLPTLAGKLLGRANLNGRLWTALRMSELVGYHKNAFGGLMSEADHIITLCNWSKDLLVLNGVPKEKISIIRQGICREIPKETKPVEKRGAALRLAYLGRIHPTKGIDLIIRALKAVPKLLLELDIYGILQDENGYYKSLLEMAEGDPRISFKEPVPDGRIIETLKNYDFLIVPSQWLETGPMVVLEAFAAGVPVIGSNLGGIAEIIADGVDGILVEYDSINRWAAVLEGCFNNREVFIKLRKGIKRPATMGYVASEMKKLYTTFAG